MSGKKYNLQRQKIRKSTFYKNKTINSIEDIDANNILVSKKESYGNKHLHKYFIGYTDNDIIGTIICKVSTNDWIC